MRPNSIIWFERLFIGSLAVSVLDLVYHRDLLTGEIEGIEGWEMEFALILGGAVIIGFGLQILLWYFIAYRASVKAKWIYLVFCALGLSGIASTWTELSTSDVIFLVATQSMVLGSVILLFQADARKWFEAKGLLDDSDGADLKDVFR